MLGIVMGVQYRPDPMFYRHDLAALRASFPFIGLIHAMIGVASGCLAATGLLLLSPKRWLSCIVVVGLAAFCIRSGRTLGPPAEALLELPDSKYLLNTYVGHVCASLLLLLHILVLGLPAVVREFREWTALRR